MQLEFTAKLRKCISPQWVTMFSTDLKAGVFVFQDVVAQFFAWLCFFIFYFSSQPVLFLGLKGLAWGQIQFTDNGLCPDCLSPSGQQELVTKTQPADSSHKICSAMRSHTFATHVPSLNWWLSKQAPSSWNLVYLVLTKEGWLFIVGWWLENK